VSDPYWKQFMHTVSFSEPDQRVSGTLEGRNQDGPREDPYPVLLLRTDSGYKLKVNVTQTRLLSELVRLRPDIGDTVTIIYHGPASKAPPGLSPTKEFSVEVTKKDSQSPTATGGISGDSGPGNSRGLGK
jgi:hypothetical protein